MNYIKIKSTDVANGEGVRVSLWVSGCPHRCKGCFNHESWNYDTGQLYTEEVEKTIIELLNKPHIKGLSVLGGEPLARPNAPTVFELCEKVKNIYGDKKDIWLWTGYDMETEIPVHLMKDIDVLIDGKFIEEKKDLNLQWRGSSNQKIWDFRKKREIDYADQEN